MKSLLPVLEPDLNKRLYIITEERPKISVIENLLAKIVIKHPLSVVFKAGSSIKPLFKNGLFTNSYEIKGLQVNSNPVVLFVGSGISSFVDYLFFYQDSKPKVADMPVSIAEVTKTDDSESRNTGIFQRASKFLYSDHFYDPTIQQFMFFDIQVVEKKTSLSHQFGSRLFATLDILQFGRKNQNVSAPFTSVDEIIAAKKLIPLPPKGNIATTITKKGNTITLTAKLAKKDKLEHDPNIGYISLVAGAIREVGWKGKIVVDNHQLPLGYQLSGENKFSHIAHLLTIELAGVPIAKPNLPSSYWKYEESKEKIGTILLAVLVDSQPDCTILYENHGGSERSYLKTPAGIAVVPKYKDKVAYKAGDKTQIVYLPDLVFKEESSKIIYVLEGKKFATRLAGVKELENMSPFESILAEHYQGYTIQRGLVLAGKGDVKLAKETSHLAFYVNDTGVIVLGSVLSPKIMTSINDLARKDVQQSEV